MPKRKTVKINLDVVSRKIKATCRSNVVFCERMDRPNQNSWVSDWKRGRNLPSPEEAARMCAILQVTPEEILMEQADIELVQGLIDSQRSEQKEKLSANDSEEQIGPKKQALIDKIKNMSDNEVDAFLTLLDR